MIVIGNEKLERFGRRHRDAKEHLSSWLYTVQNENWNTPHELRSRFPKVSIIGNGRTIFNIKGNSYRLVVAINYQDKIIQIRFIGTHAEYDRIDALEV